MQILYVGNGNYKYRGVHYYDVGRKLLNGFTRNGHNVYLLSDRDTARSTLFGSRKFGIRHCNQVFVDTCYNFSPDFILFGHADIITNKSLEKVRSFLPQVKIAQFNVDAVFRPRNVDNIKQKLPYVDATFVTTAGPILKQVSHPKGLAAYMPNPVDASMEWPRCHEHSDQENDVFWALRATGGSYPNDPRIDFPLYLEQSGKVKIDYHGMNGKPELRDAQYHRQIANARMGLNISAVRIRGRMDHATPEELYLYSSDRISHYMGSGLLTFTTRDNGMEELFVEDKELVFFSTKEELLEKILYFKAHVNERKEIAHAGWQKSHTHLNERLVAKFIEEVTFRLPLTEQYVWPTQTY